MQASKEFGLVDFKVWGTCFYSSAYMTQTHDQKDFTVTEVAADWHEPVIPQPHYMAVHCPHL